MLGKRVGNGQDMTARPESDGHLWPRFRPGAEAAVQLTQPRDCDSAVSLREGFERDVELRGETKARRHLAKLYDLGDYRQRRDELPPPQRLGLVRQCRKPAVHAVLPIIGCPRDRTRCDAS